MGYFFGVPMILGTHVDDANRKALKGLAAKIGAGISGIRAQDGLMRSMFRGVSLGRFDDFHPVVLTRRCDGGWQGDVAIEGLGGVYRIPVR